MLFRQFFDRTSSTCTYLLASGQGREALIIDPVKEQSADYLMAIRDLDLRLVHAIDTHSHADHITALGALRDATGCVTMHVSITRSLKLPNPRLMDIAVPANPACGQV